jgi:hypothetical protein
MEYFCLTPLKLIVDLIQVYQHYFILLMSHTLYISVLALNPLLDPSVEPNALCYVEK